MDKEATEDSSKKVTEEAEVEKPAMTMEIEERGGDTMEKPDKTTDETESRVHIENDKREESQKQQHQGIPIVSWPPFPQYKKVKTNNSFKTELNFRSMKTSCAARMLKARNPNHFNANAIQQARKRREEKPAPMNV